MDTSVADGGRVWYRETRSQADRDRAQREIRAVFCEADSFTPHMVFMATWDHVKYGGGGADNKVGRGSSPESSAC